MDQEKVVLSSGIWSHLRVRPQWPKTISLVEVRERMTEAGLPTKKPEIPAPTWQDRLHRRRAPEPPWIWFPMGNDITSSDYRRESIAVTGQVVTVRFEVPSAFLPHIEGTLPVEEQHTFCRLCPPKQFDVEFELPYAPRQISERIAFCGGFWFGSGFDLKKYGRNWLTPDEYRKAREEILTHLPE